jgi:hypothetical protein
VAVSPATQFALLHFVVVPVSHALAVVEQLVLFEQKIQLKLVLRGAINVLQSAV